MYALKPFKPFVILTNRILLIVFVIKSFLSKQCHLSQIRDGPSSTSPLLKKLCGSPSSVIVKSTGNDVYIRFVSSSTHQIGSGFSLYYFSQTSGIASKFLHQRSAFLSL